MRFKRMSAKRYYSRRSRMTGALNRASRHAREIPEHCTLANKLLRVTNCRPGKTCSNMLFCDGCLACRKHRYMKRIVEQEKPLYAYLRQESYIVPEIDWKTVKETYIKTLKTQKSKLAVALRHRVKGGSEKGMADLRGSIHRIEIIPIKKHWKIMLTSLLLFPEKEVHSMSPFWQEKVEYPDGRTAIIKYIGRMSKDTYVAGVLDHVFRCRIRTYSSMKPEDLIQMCKSLENTCVLESAGKMFHNQTFEN